MPQYQPYTYQPLLRGAFVSGVLSPDAPETLRAYVAAKPDTERHVASLWQFTEWMRAANPSLYSIIQARRPDLLNPTAVIEAGALSPVASAQPAPPPRSWGLVPGTPPTNNPIAALRNPGAVPGAPANRPLTNKQSLSGLRGGLGYTLAPGVEVNPDTGDVVTASMPASMPTAAGTSEPASPWGKAINDFLTGSLPPLLAMRQQDQLLRANITLAERGLPPINPASIAPQMNVGLSPSLQLLAVVAVGGLMLAGLSGALRSSKR